MEQFGYIVSSICILMAWSYLIKENAVYNFAEHLLVGMAVGRGIAYTIEVQLKPRIVDGMIGQGRWSLIIPATIGCLIYFRFVRGYEWLSRICNRGIGYGAGNALAFNPQPTCRKYSISFQNGRADNIIYFYQSSVLWYFIFTVRKDSGFGQQFSRAGTR